MPLRLSTAIVYFSVTASGVGAAERQSATEQSGELDPNCHGICTRQFRRARFSRVLERR